MKRILRIALWSIVFLLLVLMFLPFIVAGGLRTLWVILFGWLGFLTRVVPEVKISWSGVGMVVLCSGLIVGGTHWLCSWFARQRPEAPRWRWSGSLALYGFLWMLFLAAMGITGFAHQVSWLVGSKVPWFAPQKRLAAIQIANLKAAAQILYSAGQTENWHDKRTRQRFTSDYFFTVPSNQNLLEELQLVTVPDVTGKVILATLSYRNPTDRKKLGAYVIRPGNNASYDSIAYADLATVISNAMQQANAKP